MEQNKNSLVKFTNEGLEKLKDIKAYSGDASLKIACQQMLMFYKDEAEKKYQDIIDYQLKKDNFDKSKAAFDAHSPKNRTKQVMDEYNKSINDFNNAVKQVNARSNELNNTRNKNINNWNSTADSFTQSHI
jgi:vacuolar-type H+-ATPase subunit I/STV1